MAQCVPRRTSACNILLLPCITVVIVLIAMFVDHIIFILGSRSPSLNGRRADEDAFAQSDTQRASALSNSSSAAAPASLTDALTTASAGDIARHMARRRLHASMQMLSACASPIARAPAKGTQAHHAARRHNTPAQISAAELHEGREGARANKSARSRTTSHIFHFFRRHAGRFWAPPWGLAGPRWGLESTWHPTGTERVPLGPRWGLLGSREAQRGPKRLMTHEPKVESARAGSLGYRRPEFPGGHGVRDCRRA